MADSTTSNLILANDEAHTDQTQFLLLEFLKANGLDGGGSLVQDFRHVSGESNPSQTLQAEVG
jgi:hypothetical protein